MGSLDHMRGSTGYASANPLGQAEHKASSSGHLQLICQYRDLNSVYSHRPSTCHWEPAGTISDYALGKQRRCQSTVDAKGLAPGIKCPEDTFSNRVYRKTSKSQNNVISVNRTLAEQNHMRYSMLLLIQERLRFSFVGS